MTKSINRRMAELVTATGDIVPARLTGVNLLDSADIVSIGNNTSSGTQVFDTLDSLPTSSLNAGQQAFVNENNRLYISNGTGWYNLTFVNRTPTWYTEPDATYEIADSATPLIVTAKAQDSDNSDLYLLNQSIGTDSAQYMVNVSNDSSVFTFTPKSADSIGVEVAAGNLTDSNGDFIYTFKWSDGINFVAKTVTIAYNPASGSTALIYGDRAVILGGNSRASYIDYYDITTPMNAVDFGDTRYYDGSSRSTVVHGGAVSNGARAVYSVNNPGCYETIVPSTPADSTLFGNLYDNEGGKNACTDGSRGVFMGNDNEEDTMEYITIDVTGTASNFAGVLTLGRGYGGGTSDGTKGFFIGGKININNSIRATNVIDWITIQVPSDSTDFGDLLQALQIRGATSDDTGRAIVGGGMTATNDVFTNQIQYFSMGTTGSCTNFGNLTRNAGASCTGNGTYATWNGGMTSSPFTYYTNVIERVTIQTPGNAADFGDLYHGVNATYGNGGNGHVATSGNAA